MYKAGNIIGTNCIVSLLSTMEADMITVGWVNVASGNIASNGTPVRWDVFKSPGSNNSIANDFYVLLGTDNATNTQLFITTCVGYNTTTNAVSSFPPVAASMPAAANTLAANQTANTCNTGNVWTLESSTMPTAGFGMNYYYSVTQDRVIVSVGNTAAVNIGTCFYAGIYDSFMTLAVDPYPLVVANIASPQSVSQVTNGVSASPSEPAGAVVNAGNFTIGTAVAWNNITSADPYLGSRSGLSRQSIIGRGLNNGIAGFRGLLKDCYVSPLQGGRGDLINWQFNGTTYIATGFGNGAALFSGGTLTVNHFGPYVLQV